MASDSPPSLYEVTKQEVQTTLGQIRTDIANWGSNAERALADVNSAVNAITPESLGLGFSPLSPPTLAVNYQPERPVRPDAFKPPTYPTYKGPTSFTEFAPSGLEPDGKVDDLTFQTYTFQGPSISLTELPNPGTAPKKDCTFKDPGDPPTSDVSDISDYNDPGWEDPDLSKIYSDSWTPGTYGGKGSVTDHTRDNVQDPKDLFKFSGMDEPDPTDPTLYTPGRVGFNVQGSQPDWTGRAPNLDFSGEPGAFSWVDLGDPPNIPDVPDITYDGPLDPQEPSLIEISVPDIRDVALPTFAVPITAEEIPNISGGLSYEDPGYSDAQTDLIRQEVSRVLNGDVGIPEYLWDAIWDKSSAQVHRQGVARERQGRQAWAKLGWSMPGGVALAQAEQAYQDINQQLSESAREKAIQRATMEREDFWQAVQQGVAFQKVMMDLYNGFQERRLRAEVATVEALVNIYNANVANYSAKLARVQAAIAVKELELKGALAVLEVDKAKLEGAKLRSEINEQMTRVYIAKWEAVKAAVEKFKALVEAQRTKLDAQRLKIEAFGEKVKTRSVEVEAWAKMWDGYATKVEAQKTKTIAYETEAKAFGSLMQGYGVSVEAAKAESDVNIRNEQLRLEEAKHKLEKYVSGWQGVSARLDAKTKIESANAQAWSAWAQYEAAYNGAKVDLEKVGVDAFSAEIQAEANEASQISAKGSAFAAMWNAASTAYKAKSDGELAVIQAEGERARAENTKVDAEAKSYLARVEGNKADAEGRLKELEGLLASYKTEIDANRIKAEQDIASYTAQIKKDEAGIENAKGNAQIQASQMSAQGDRQRAIATAFEARARAAEIANSAQAQLASAYASFANAEASLAEAEARGEAARLSAEAQVETAISQANNLEAEIERHAVQAEVLKFEAAAKNADMEQRRLIENARVAVEQIVGLTNITVQGLNGIASAYAMMCSSAYSAANVSAGLDARASSSNDYSENHNYQHLM